MPFTLSSWFSGSLEVLFPLECVVCTRPLRGRSLCSRCTPTKFRFHGERCEICYDAITLHEGVTEPFCPACVLFPPLPKRIRYLWEYSGCARDLIRAMKYRPSVSLTRYGGECLREGLFTLFPLRNWDVVAPIPSSPSMLRKRLFHPCHEMAKSVRRALPDAEIVPLLSHKRRKPPQATLSHTERLRGMRDVFGVNHPALVSGKRILLIEDVITTGATIAAASLALYRAGALEVDVLALAQARVWRRLRARIYHGIAPSDSIDSSLAA